MAEPEKDRPSLELPKLGLRRRKRPASPSLAESPAEPAAEPPAEPSAELPPGPPAGPASAHDATPEPEPEPVPVPAPAPAVEETRPIVGAESAPAAAADPDTAADPEAEAAAVPARPRRERGPGGVPAALLTGVVVGLGIVGLTRASLRSCEGLRGTSSCGDGGYPLLALMLVVMVLVGWLLLRLLRVPDPATTSFLAVGLAMVVALLLLVDHLMDRSMVAVIPALCAATYALAHRLTSTFVEPPRD